MTSSRNSRWTGGGNGERRRILWKITQCRIERKTPNETFHPVLRKLLLQIRKTPGTLRTFRLVRFQGI